MSSNQPSLRAFARRVGCTHSAIGQAVRAGRLVAGFALDGNRVTVVDADLAEREWNAIHVEPPPSVGLPPGRPRKVSPPSPADPLLYDGKMDLWVTAGALLGERDTYSLLASAMAAALLDGIGDRAAVELVIAEHLGIVADLHGADSAEVNRAIGAVSSILDMLASVAAEERGT
jgi:hypothetical protein